MTLTRFVQTVARGAGRARPLTLDEARDAMTIILDGKAQPEALGAFLMVLRFRGEIPEEIAGFTDALRQKSPAPMGADLDWPSYAAGRTRGAPLFLLSAKLVAQAGYRVVLHGWNSHQSTGASVRDALGALDIPMDASDAPITYLPVETHAPEAFEVLRLRDTFGLRSCINTVLRMWNPTNAPATVQGVFHPSYRGLQAQAAALLGQSDLTVIKGGGGEFERNPAKAIRIFGLRNGEHHQTDAAAIREETRRMNEPEAQVDAPALWSGQQSDPFAEATVIGTAGIALWTMGAAQTVEQADAMAATLWEERHSQQRISA
ncbi:glycosyl transferase family protein [Loktanella sp. S4079]|uniref:glycosyl transferase family protein n=1 Tax=Loktanella sp. S4079 TaxID=579483 RepID=UPI0005F9DDFE|nr:glycosyl transferase family protein [Loktanella sp. S4079]KJZ19658.1 glycosyl transferase family 3 [Loktanella sp. S4079]